MTATPDEHQHPQAPERVEECPAAPPFMTILNDHPVTIIDPPAAPVDEPNAAAEPTEDASDDPATET